MAARRHYRGLTWLGRARRAGGAPAWSAWQAKGHLISKGLTGILNSSKENNEKILPTVL